MNDDEVTRCMNNGELEYIYYRDVRYCPKREFWEVGVGTARYMWYEKEPFDKVPVDVRGKIIEAKARFGASGYLPPLTQEESWKSITDEWQAEQPIIRPIWVDYDFWAWPSTQLLWWKLGEAAGATTNYSLEPTQWAAWKAVLLGLPAYWWRRWKNLDSFERLLIFLQVGFVFVGIGGILDLLAAVIHLINLLRK